MFFNSMTKPQLSYNYFGFTGSSNLSLSDIGLLTCQKPWRGRPSFVTFVQEFTEYSGISNLNFDTDNR